MNFTDYYTDIPIGKENAITRKELQKKWGVNDRRVREIISILRSEDYGDPYIIISASSAKGFYKTDNKNEILAYKKEVTARARHTFAPLRKVNRVLTETGEQVSLLTELDGII